MLSPFFGDIITSQFTNLLIPFSDDEVLFMNRTTRNANGFSIIELLVVVAIIGILTVVAIPAYFNHVNRTRQSNAVQKLIDMKTAQEKYYALYDRYAPSETNANYSSMLSFALADTEYYTFTTNGSTNTFTAQIGGNNVSLNNDCWQITGPWAEPSTCGTPDGFSFSVLGDLFD